MAEQQHSYFPISALTILPRTAGRFDLFLKRHDEYVLYCHAGDEFGDETASKILDVSEFYVRQDQREEYEQYLAGNLAEMLADETIPVRDRAKVFYNISQTVVKNVFETKLPRPYTRETQVRLRNIVKASMHFFVRPEALRSLSQFISRSYSTYSHSIRVQVLTASLLQQYPATPRQNLVEAGMGALLHDIGKKELPREILNRPSEECTEEERELFRSHSVKGVHVCKTMELSRLTNQCILFHHERLDGRGYPKGLKSADIPFEVKALSLCDIYDNLTTDRPGRPAMTPFKALEFIKDARKSAISQDLFRKFVRMLSNARVI